MATRVPKRLEEWRVRRATAAAARREAHRRDPHARGGKGAKAAHEPVGYQRLVLGAVGRWIDRLAARSRPVQQRWLRAVQSAADQIPYLLSDLAAMDRQVPDRVLTGDLVRHLIPAVMLAHIVEIAALWPVVDDLPLPIALLAATAISLATACVAVLFGLAIGALVFNERDSSHELSPREKVAWGVGASVLGPLVLAAAIVLAVMRGSWLWLPLSLVLLAIEVVWGVCVWETRHLRQRDAKRRDLAKAVGDGRAACVALDHEREHVMGAGRDAVGKGRHALRSGEVAFDKQWERHNWRKRIVAPAVPDIQLPTDAELAERLLVPVGADAQQVIDLFAGLAPSDVEDGRVPNRGRRLSSATGQLPPAI